jgi:hypothetical protein
MRKIYVSRKKKRDDDFDSAFDGEVFGKQKSSGFSYKASCYESHKPLVFGAGKVYGGSCSRPTVKDADIYIGLDSWMEFRHTKYPWNPPGTTNGPIEVLFQISDGSAPKHANEFVKMIDWLVLHIAAGLTVHVGCIGGHGRTGMVLAALVKKIKGTEDAITWLRENYCKKAVETETQVKFLNKYFGIKVVQGSKEGHGTFAGYGTRGTYTGIQDEYLNGISQRPGTVVHPMTGLPIYRGEDGTKSLPAPKRQIVASAKGIPGKHSIW